MARYIDADEYRKRLEMICGDGYIKQLIDIFIDWFMSIAESTESADVAPVIHAHKVRAHSQGGGTHWVVCSHCEQPIDWQDDYCKHCGAKMDEEQK